MIQELWLTEQQLNELDSLGFQYVARSGMEEAVAAGIVRGRPFGGVGIVWTSDLNHVITPLSNYKHKRVVAAELKTKEHDIIMISAYMPFFNASKRVECLQETIDAISMIELIIEDHPNHLVVIGGDLNTELTGKSPFDPLWRELMDKNRFAYCDNFISSPRYTYHHESLDQRKFNDHFIISQEFLDLKLAKGHKILEDGDNISDHLPILMSLSLNLESFSRIEPINLKPTINWEKLSPDEIQKYSDRLWMLVEEKPSRMKSCGLACGCQDDACRQRLQEEYDCLLSCIKKASDAVPRQKPGSQKDWWTPELTKLRDQSREIQQLWLLEGRPGHGPTHIERLRVKAAYKRTLRLAKRAPKQDAWNKLHSAMETKDTTSFWKWWRAIYSNKSKKVAPVVEGCSTKESITAVFEKSFQSHSKPNDANKVDSINKSFQDNYAKFCADHISNCDCSLNRVSVSNVIDALGNMKTGKSADDDGLQAEHFLNAPFNLVVRFMLLFNSMLCHAFVPSQFKSGTIIPIIKDKQGSSSDVNNYRGITISPIASKLFEHALRLVFADHLTTSHLQFGFKSKSSTAHALFCLKETVNYYIDHGNRVYCSFLDASKAFDRLVHAGLFSKLIQRGAPKCLIDILISWYDGLRCRVRWDDYTGNWFSISAGVRQGGVLSPAFYSIYIDDLLCILKSSGIGCHMADVFAAALFYADDMAILAPSIKGLQKLLNLCSSFCADWDICLNSKKTKNMWFGKKQKVNAKIRVHGNEIDWVHEWKYLGVMLRSGSRFGCSVTDRVKQFYRSLNSILRVEGRSEDMTLLRLVEAHCVPVLTYAMEICHVADRDERRSLRVAYNAIFRKLFGYRYSESVTDLQHSLGRSTWEETVDDRYHSFLMRVKKCPPESLVHSICLLMNY